MSGQRKRTMQADNASQQHRTKRNNNWWNNKEDKSLWGTTTKLVYLIPVIKMKNKSQEASARCEKIFIDT